MEFCQAPGGPYGGPEQGREMYTYTFITLVDGVKAGGMTNASIREIWDLMTDQDGEVDTLFMGRLTHSVSNQAMKVERSRVFPTDEHETTTVTIAYRN